MIRKTGEIAEIVKIKPGFHASITGPAARSPDGVWGRAGFPLAAMTGAARGPGIKDGCRRGGKVSQGLPDRYNPAFPPVPADGKRIGYQRRGSRSSKGRLGLDRIGESGRVGRRRREEMTGP